MASWNLPPDATPREVVQRILDRSPYASYVEVEVAWRALHGETDLDRLRREYDEEVAERRARAAEAAPGHGRRVILTVAVWIAVHLVVWAALGLPFYLLCRQSSSYCGISLGLTALGIGGLQLIYGLIVGFVLRGEHPAVGQGILIGTGLIALLFTGLCFAALGW